MRKLTLSHILQILLVVGVGVLIWQVILLRQTLLGQQEMFSQSTRPTARDVRALPVRVVNDSLTVDVGSVTDTIQVDVTNEPNVHVTNSTLDVYVSNP